MIKPDDEEKSLLYVLKNLPIFYWDSFSHTYHIHWALDEFPFSGRTCKSQDIFQSKPGYTNGFNQSQFRIVYHVAILVVAWNWRDCVERQGNCWRNDERNGDHCNHLYDERLREF